MIDMSAGIFCEYHSVLTSRDKQAVREADARKFDLLEMIYG